MFSGGFRCHPSGFFGVYAQKLKAENARANSRAAVIEESVRLWAQTHKKAALRGG